MDKHQHKTKLQHPKIGFNLLKIKYTGNISGLSYLPTPPLGQDMTQGQFLSGI